MMRSLLLSVLLLAAAGPVALAADEPAPKPPELSPLPESGVDEQPVPDVTITRRAEDTVAEYRINGRLYMIKVTPKKGLPYFLVDTDGDGNLETRHNDLDPGIAVPSWVLLRW